ncbi:BgTH12-01430 [Blumeria graminis f. sp. triticale]|uniref:Bgt-672 n=3 Tax=Blumeria graminis TaxID=34373 RepID=A0A061HL28_BLUGR|nr:hypothetical protein BGT96224_672 [Blumeria graminis f. sp. tritici 96224]CAD6501176.1 BgTH12-01430 [Blumeria graminis f. sp. triticale]VDB83579.1 Bgt-672 [Blumeria graminis f. sp. tritici]
MAAQTSPPETSETDSFQASCALTSDSIEAFSYPTVSFQVQKPDRRQCLGAKNVQAQRAKPFSYKIEMDQESQRLLEDNTCEDLQTCLSPSANPPTSKLLALKMNAPDDIEGGQKEDTRNPQDSNMLSQNLSSFCLTQAQPRTLDPMPLFQFTTFDESDYYTINNPSSSSYVDSNHSAPSLHDKDESHNFKIYRQNSIKKPSDIPLGAPTASEVEYGRKESLKRSTNLAANPVRNGENCSLDRQYQSTSHESTKKESQLSLSENNSAVRKLPGKKITTSPATSETTVPLIQMQPTSGIQKREKEIYGIKKIRWHDHDATKNPRISPILVQNSNGPCPLLALVNALILSTPPSKNTYLTETLNSREDITLGLLLDALFDELISRRGSGNELPDVSALYSFLVTLHTGMNVNPHFFPASLCSTIKRTLSSRSVKHSRPERIELGFFEDTYETQLYGTFNVPLIHGWIPQPDSMAYAALYRLSRTFEDAQNLLFSEEILETKRIQGTLTSHEESLLEDIATIGTFISSNATQLTSHGLDVIKTTLTPGTTAILFRNNHFSTLYRHPKNLQLLQLVTDMGYAKHEGVVWESLVDTTGELAEFFDGDFRRVIDTPAWPLPNLPLSNNDRISCNTSSYPSDHSKRSCRGTMEQLDHDYALALLLQEEEQQKSVKPQRQCHGIKSSPQQFTLTHTSDGQDNSGVSRPEPLLSQQIRCESGPVIPPRRSNLNFTNQLDSESAMAETEVGLPPPSYEAATKEECNNSSPEDENPQLNHSVPQLSHSDTLESESRSKRVGGMRRRSRRHQSQAIDQILAIRSGMSVRRQPSLGGEMINKVTHRPERVERECAIM